MDWKTIWMAVTALCGEAPKLDYDNYSGTWRCSFRATSVFEGTTKVVYGEDAEVPVAVELAWEFLRSGEGYIRIGNRCVRFAGEHVGFVPHKVARPKKEAVEGEE